MPIAFVYTITIESVNIFNRNSNLFIYRELLLQEDEADDDYDDGDPFSDDAEEWQAEEATEPPRPKPVSSITQFKWDNYGTRSRVEESRRQQLNLKPNNDCELFVFL